MHAWTRSQVQHTIHARMGIGPTSSSRVNIQRALWELLAKFILMASSSEEHGFEGREELGHTSSPIHIGTESVSHKSAVEEGRRGRSSENLTQWAAPWSKRCSVSI